MRACGFRTAGRNARSTALACKKHTSMWRMLKLTFPKGANTSIAAEWQAGDLWDGLDRSDLPKEQGGYLRL